MKNYIYASGTAANIKVFILAAKKKGWIFQDLDEYTESYMYEDIGDDIIHLRFNNNEDDGYLNKGKFWDIDKDDLKVAISTTQISIHLDLDAEISYSINFIMSFSPMEAWWLKDSFLNKS